MPPESIAHYRITSNLGAGGMGEVYRATDTKLNRDVAIKLLPEAFAADPDRLARFTREAQVLASLNHPNIAAIYGVEERALILELVEGPTLAERIGQGAIPWDEALPIAKQIAEALEYAHERGIVHRDLKPANIKVTREGRVKVLDFGLAKAMSSNAPASNPESSPTLTMHGTLLGVILGTAAYMSPEQARGQDADRRADVWSCGVVLYEMLAGRTLFAGATISDTLAAVLTKEPDLSGIPPHVRPIVERCLRQDPGRRWQAIGDMRLALEEGPPATAVMQRARRAVVPWAVAAVLGVALAVTAGLFWRAPRQQLHSLVRFNVDLGPAALPGTPVTAILSPDGSRIVYFAEGQDGAHELATRPLDQPDGTLLAGTNGASAPFFSPDGNWIGFFAARKLKKIFVPGGGAAVTLCDARPPVFGGSWGEDGYIVFSSAGRGLQRVPDTGGTPEIITQPDAVEYLGHRFPQVLNGGREILFTATTSSDYESADLQVFSIGGARPRTLLHGGYFGRYLNSGHLVYVHENILFGVPLDPSRLVVTGTAVPLVEDLAAVTLTGAGHYDFSRSGTLVYASGKPKGGWTIESLDSVGHPQPMVKAPARYTAISLSPDGGRLAVAEIAGGESIWIYDRRRESMSKLTAAGQANYPVWAPDGKHLACVGPRGGRYVLSWIRVDGAGEPQTLLDSEQGVWPTSFSPDGRLLAFHRRRADGGLDVVTLPLDLADPEHPRPGQPVPFVSTPFVNVEAVFSPDGHWIAYQSSESGTAEVYVRPFPSGGQRLQVSTGGGSRPIWPAGRRELFYQSPDNYIMTAGYTVNRDTLSFEKPRRRFANPMFTPGTGRIFDVAPDGQHFAVLASPEAPPELSATVHVTFLLNFFDELKRRVPVK